MVVYWLRRIPTQLTHTGDLVMKLASPFVTMVFALNLAMAQADDQFSTLEDIQAQAMSTEEMDAVQGRILTSTA